MSYCIWTSQQDFQRSGVSIAGYSIGEYMVPSEHSRCLLTSQKMRNHLESNFLERKGMSSQWGMIVSHSHRNLLYTCKMHKCSVRVMKKSELWELYHKLPCDLSDFAVHGNYDNKVSIIHGECMRGINGTPMNCAVWMRHIRNKESTLQNSIEDSGVNSVVWYLECGKAGWLEVCSLKYTQQEYHHSLPCSRRHLGRRHSGRYPHWTPHMATLQQDSQLGVSSI